MIHQSHPPSKQASLSALHWRVRRGCLNVRRIEYEASVLASVHGAVRLGHDLELVGLLRGVGLSEDAISALRFRGTGGEYGVILPTERTWNQTRLKERAFDVGLRASATVRPILIISPAELRLEPRLGNAQHIFRAKTAPACGDMETLTACIDDRGGEAALVECEAALAGPHPRERVFGLVYSGHLAMNLEVGLTDRSAVRLRHPFPNWGWEALGWRPIQAAQPDPAGTAPS
jgi:hypothetical protein